MIIRSLSTGIRRASAAYRMLLLLYAVNLSFAGLLAYSFHAMLTRAFGDSLAALVLLSEFDYSIVSDFRALQPELFPIFLTEVAVALVIFTLLQTFFSGGIIVVVLGESSRFSIRRFILAGAAYFFRFLRLLLFMGTLMLVIALLLSLVLALSVQSLRMSASSEKDIILTVVGGGGVFLLAGMSLLIIFDYARVLIVRGSLRSSIRAAVAGFRFILRHIGSVTGLQALLLLLSLGVAGLQVVLWTPFPMATLSSITAVVLVHQIFALVRVWIRIVFFSSETSLVELSGFLPFQAASAPTEQAASS